MWNKFNPTKHNIILIYICDQKIFLENFLSKFSQEIFFGKIFLTKFFPSIFRESYPRNISEFFFPKNLQYWFLIFSFHSVQNILISELKNEIIISFPVLFQSFNPTLIFFFKIKPMFIQKYLKKPITLCVNCTH